MEEEKNIVNTEVSATPVTEAKNNRNFNRDRKPRREFKKNFTCRRRSFK